MKSCCRNYKSGENRNRSGYLGFIIIACLSVLAIFLHSCKPDEKGDKDDFDRSAMLAHFADSLIIPAYTQLNLECSSLAKATDTFISRKDSASLSVMQNHWKRTYLSLMSAAPFNFGPAGEEGIRKSLVEEIATWPANTSLIESNISAGNFTLNDFNRDNRGLGAMDYLIFDISGNHSVVLQSFKSSANRLQYLKAIVEKVKSQVESIAQKWQADFRGAFVGNNGTSAGSSASESYNEFVKSFENLKNFKLAIPLGLRAGQTSTEPSRVEARYSGISLELIKKQWITLVNCWYGRTQSGYDGPGWKDYLLKVTGGPELVSRTEVQINQISTMLDNLPASPSLELQIGSNFTALSNLHTELQKNTRNFKSDMSSLLGIAITYSSGDGD